MADAARRLPENVTGPFQASQSNTRALGTLGSVKKYVCHPDVAQALFCLPRRDSELLKSWKMG
jgi:hypothetical protein